MAQRAVKQFAFSIRLACDAFSISEKCYRYQVKLSSDNQQIADWLLRLTHNQWNWGFDLCFLYLRNVKGLKWASSPVYACYQNRPQFLSHLSRSIEAVGQTSTFQELDSDRSQQGSTRTQPEILSESTGIS